MEDLSMVSLRWLLVVAIILHTPIAAFAQLRFVQPTVNLGELRGGPAYQHRFEFVNAATQSIEVVDFRLGCGCLQPMLDKRVFQAGEKGVLVMNLRTLGQPNAARSWQAHVQYRQGGELREAVLVLGATIRNEITVEPSIVAMTIDTSMRQEIVIKDMRDKPLKVSAALASSPAIRVTLQPMANGVAKVVLDVSREALTAARQEETLSIYTDDPAYRQLQVPITLMRAKREGVSASPAAVEIVGTGSQLVRLRAAGDQVVRVEKVDADHPDVKCTWAAGPGTDATLRIRVASPHGALATVRVRLSAPTGTTITIPVSMRKE
jgi:hypothetical protein